MSTFRGIVDEFPDIRIDFFRNITRENPTFACFLSHVHSDHLQGLESLHGLFVYCSSATRELLLKLEKYPHRLNFETGILESRIQHYKHLSSLLKTIPLNVPTEIELRNGISIRVTLLDANHCTGAVMFLIENETKAILYSGDIRSEPWWVNSLIRNPVVLPYTHGIKRLDKIYLDTTFATKKRLYRVFPTKADGLQELLEKVKQYPKDTIFHFHAWTFGYEEVWIALAKELRSQIHVDNYRYRLYKSLCTTPAGENSNQEGAALLGFKCGNGYQAGCLTQELNVRLHSCERGTKCSTLLSPNVVYITPVISRSAQGIILPEVGAGGGGGDLIQAHQLELDDPDSLAELIKLCTNQIVDKKGRLNMNTLAMRIKAMFSHQKAVSIDSLDLSGSDGTMPLEMLARVLVKVVDEHDDIRYQINNEVDSSAGKQTNRTRQGTDNGRQELPRHIQFPYSRHSSYGELCDLVKAFMPIDVYPCTVDEENWSFEDSIENLFGHLCSGTVFMHDEEMKMKKLSRKANFKRRRDDGDSQFMTSSMQGSVEFELAQSQDTSNLPRSSSDVEHHADDDSYHGSKRLRTSQACARTNQGDHGSRTESLPADARSPRRKLRNVKQSFEGVRRHPKAEAALDTRNASSPTLNDTGDPLSLADGPISHHPNPRPTTHPDGDPKVNMRQRSRPEDDPVQIPRGTQAEPIELSDDERLSSDNEAGNFLFERLAEPEHLQKTSDGSQSGDPDTQLSLSDAAFESQLSHITNPDAKAVRMQHRKEAYKAARGLGGRWELDHGLVSSGHLGEEEPEL